MTKVNNQLTVITKKDKKTEKEKFSVRTHKSSEKALELPPNAFKLWYYLGMNKDGYNLYLSPNEVMKVCNMSNGTYQKAKKDLIEHRFLTPTKKAKDEYIFCEYPLPSVDFIEEEEQKPRIKGFVF